MVALCQTFLNARASLAATVMEAVRLGGASGSAPPGPKLLAAIDEVMRQDHGASAIRRKLRPADLRWLD